MNTHIKYKYHVIVEYLSKYTKQHFLGLTVNTSTAEADGMSDCMYFFHKPENWTNKNIDQMTAHCSKQL